MRRVQEKSDAQIMGLDLAKQSAYADVLVPSLEARSTMRAWGSRYARLVLERCSNNKRQACRELGISYHTLQNYLRFRPERAGSSLR